MSLDQTTSFHFHDGKRLIRGFRGVGVPRVGDEIRLDSGSFYKVLRVIWVYDEPDATGQRVNIELEPIT